VGDTEHSLQLDKVNLIAFIQSLKVKFWQILEVLGYFDPEGSAFLSYLNFYE
jgi:hypothetical protein